MSRRVSKSHSDKFHKNSKKTFSIFVLFFYIFKKSSFMCESLIFCADDIDDDAEHNSQIVTSEIREIEFFFVDDFSSLMKCGKFLRVCHEHVKIFLS